MKFNARLVNGTYKTDGKNFKMLFTLKTRNEETGEIEKIVQSWTPEFPPYMFCDGGAITFLRDCFLSSKIRGVKFIPRKDVQLFRKADRTPYQVVVNTPENISRIKKLKLWKNNLWYNDNHIYEANIPYVIRHLIDKDLGVWLSFDLKNKKMTNWEDPDLELLPTDLYADLETDDTASNVPIVERKILSISYGTNISNVQNFQSKKEREILLHVKQLVEDYDNLIFWNGKNFDEPVLKAAAKRCKVKINWNKIGFIDQAFVMQRIHKKFGGRYGLPLDEVAWRLCKKRKVPLKHGFTWLAENDPDKLAEYNDWDVKLMIWIEEACGTLNEWKFACDGAGIPAGLAKYVSVVPNTRYIRKAIKKTPRLVVPTGKSKKEGKSFAGAVVGDPPFGVFSDCWAVDIEGSYVGIMRTYGVSPEVWNGKGYDPDGIIAEDLEELTMLRNEYKVKRDAEPKGSKMWKYYESMQYGMKRLSLLYYGEQGRETSPIYVQQSAAFVTEKGRDNIERAENKLGQLFPIQKLYKDTDSVYWRFLFDMKWDKTSVEAMFKNVLEALNLDFDRMQEIQGIPPEKRYIKMGGQAFYSKILWAGIKKHYMFYERYNCDTKEWFDVPQLGIKGWVKRDKGEFALDVQHFFGRLMLDGVTLDSEPNILEYLKQIKRDYMRGKFNDYIVLKKGLRMKLKDYVKSDFILTAAKKAKDEGKYVEGFTFHYVVTHADKGGIEAEAVWENNIPEIHISGLRYMWERYFWSNIMAILKAFGKEESFIKGSLEGNIKARKFLG